MVVAPLEADCWYGISTPCSMVASFWLAVMTRGEEMMFAWVSAWAADSSRSTMKLLPRMPRANEPAGLLTGRLTLYRLEAVLPDGNVTGKGVPVPTRLVSPLVII